MEGLFSEQDLKQIQHEAAINTDYYLDTTVVDGNATEKSIIKISKDNQLIFVEGNEATGFEHLRDRHSFFSSENYWTGIDGSTIKLDKPSKFHPNMMPIIDYVNIADSIFKIGNKNVTKNSNPDLFDKYTGEYTYEGLKEQYHLIVYKDTKVVHTLFPNQKRNNIKSKFKYAKGEVTSSLNFKNGINDLIVPYENDKKITVYSILIRKFYKEKIERLFIQKHDAFGVVNKMYLLGSRKFNDFESFDREMMGQFQHSNLSDFENTMIQIDKEVSENNSSSK